jgi:hypothetical protein
MIPKHPSWDIIDSSKISCYLQCPRKFFYSYVLGWRLDIPEHDLHFGEAWHQAREYQLIHGYQYVDEAYEVFLKCYRKYFSESTDNNFKPKTPEAVYQALLNFGLYYPSDLTDNELLRNEQTGEPFTEISGSAPISDTRRIYFRMDSLLRRKSDGKIFSWDHKTTKASYLRWDWDKQFLLGVQNGTYTHAMYCIYPADIVLGVEFCGTGFEYLPRGSKARPAGYYSEFRRVPAFKSPDQMGVWLYLVNDVYDRIEADFGYLEQMNEGDNTLCAFPINPEGCTKYRGCEFHEFCVLWSNPLRFCHEPPLGFRQEFWDPTQRDARNKLNLEWR